MGCYGCGSNEGSDARLCPKCTRKRREARGNRASIIPQRESATDSFFESLTVKVCFGGVVAILGVYLMFFSPLGPGIGMGSAEKAYQRCLNKFGHVQSKGRDGLDKMIRQNLLTDVCNAVREECTKDPNSEKCRAGI